MLKIVVVMYGVFSVLLNAAYDQGESITTSQLKRSTRELYDEAVTYFSSNPDAFSNLIAIVKNMGQSNGNTEKILSLSNSSKASSILLGTQEKYIINLLSTVKEMHKINQQKLESRNINDAPASPKATPRQVIINFD